MDSNLQLFWEMYKVPSLSFQKLKPENSRKPHSSPSCPYTLCRRGGHLRGRDSSQDHGLRMAGDLLAAMPGPLLQLLFLCIS